MTYYARSAYGTTNPNAGRPANGDTAAWGGYEWPNCPPASLQGTTDYTSRYGQRLRVSVRREIVELVELMFRICDKHGYTVYAEKDGENWGPWGGECRSISGSSNPSGHSKWLSVDINAPYNPYSYTFQSNMPPPMVADLESIGFYWGGRYQSQKYDAMHFGYCYHPADVAGHAAKAKAILGDSGTDDTTDDGTDNETDDDTEDDMPFTEQQLRAIVSEEVKKAFAQPNYAAPQTIKKAIWNVERDVTVNEKKATKTLADWIPWIAGKVQNGT